MRDGLLCASQIEKHATGRLSNVCPGASGLDNIGPVCFKSFVQPCGGDSGGPLWEQRAMQECTKSDGGQPVRVSVLTGVVAWGTNMKKGRKTSCSWFYYEQTPRDMFHPDVYTHVGSHRDFILANTKDGDVVNGKLQKPTWMDENGDCTDDFGCSCTIM